MTAPSRAASDAKDMLLFPAAEYASRVTAARAAMAARDIGVLIVGSAENLFI